MIAAVARMIRPQPPVLALGLAGLEFVICGSAMRGS
jgi:hypothetical protein